MIIAEDDTLLRRLENWMQNQSRLDVPVEGVAAALDVTTIDIQFSVQDHPWMSIHTIGGVEHLCLDGE